MTRRAAIYCRISDDREGTQLGVQRQEEDCRALAERLGATDITVYVDNDRSASTRSKKRRPSYDQMLHDAEAGNLDVIIAYSNSRLTRRPMEYEHLIRVYERHGVRIHTVASGDDDLSTADGRMVGRIKASVDAGEAERAAERVARAARQRAEHGRPNGGTRPFGWLAEDRTKLDPAEHAVIVEAGDRLLAGESVRSVVADLNARGIPTVSGAAWSPTTLRGMMWNPRLAGIRVHKGQAIGKGDWEHALDELTYQRLRSLLTDPIRRTSPGNVRKNLLTGLALCGECKDTVSVKIVSQAGRPKRARYWCRPCGLWRTKDPVDLYVNRYMARLMATYKPAPVRVGDVDAHRQVEDLRTRIANAIERFTDSESMTEEQLEDLLRALNRRLAAAEARLVPRSRVLDGLTGANPLERWGSLELERKRAVIDLLVTVTLHRGNRGSRLFDPASVQIDRR